MLTAYTTTGVNASGSQVIGGTDGTVQGVIAHPELIRDAAFQLAFTSDVAHSSDDSIRLWLQSSRDGGLSYDDFLAFNNVEGNSSDTYQEAQWVRAALGDLSSTVRAQQDGALAVGTVLQGPIGGTWRLKWTVVNDSGALFPFSLNVQVNARY